MTRYQRLACRELAKRLANISTPVLMTVIRAWADKAVADAGKPGTLLKAPGGYSLFLPPGWTMGPMYLPETNEQRDYAIPPNYRP